MASLCYNTGRIEAAVRYSDAGQLVIGSYRHEEVPFGAEGVLGASYAVIGRPERWVECAAPSSRAVATPIHSPGEP
jgi:hypothetical protein